MPIPDGAHRGVLAWFSAEQWMADARELLSSPVGSALCTGIIKVDTVMLVGREDARTADRSTGRGVTTSHKTVAKRVGMSSRHVGTARRILEKLGLQFTLVLGRHLSPAERSSARAVHGGYQEAAASVRVLTTPRPACNGVKSPPVDEARPSGDVDTFHLPRSGSVTESRHVERWSLTHTNAREKAASRRKPCKKATARPVESPRDPRLQRFAWFVAKKFHLLATHSPVRGRSVSPGALIGDRHIGQLCSALERYRITPDRFTVDSLADSFNELIVSRQLPAPSQVEARDRLAWFVWMLKRLHHLSHGETRHERALRGAAESQQRHQEREQCRIADAVATQQAVADSQVAAEAFFAASRSQRPHALASDRYLGGSEIVHALIGTAQHLYNTPRPVQVLVGHVSDLHRHLVGAGWTRMSGVTLRWSRDQDLVNVDLLRNESSVTTSKPADKQAAHDLQLLFEAIADGWRALDPDEHRPYIHLPGVLARELPATAKVAAD